MAHSVNSETCKKCGLCAEVCPNQIIEWAPSKEPSFRPDRILLCIQCGHCMAVCSTQSITAGRLSYDKDFFDLPMGGIGESDFFNFLSSRRSVRNFQDKPVPKEMLQRILDRALDEPIAAPVLRADCRVRAIAETGEIAQRAAAQREVWLPWTVGNVSDDDYARLMRLPGYLRDLDVVTATPEGVIAAYVNGWLDPVNRVGDFGPVGALPAYRRQGLTRAALLEGLRRMRAYGMERVCISTGISNTPALRLYKSIGFKIVNKYLDYVKVEGAAAD